MLGCLSIGAERAGGAERVSIAERSCGLCLSIDAERDSGAEPASIAERSYGLCGARPSSRNESFERRAAGGQLSHTRNITENRHVVDAKVKMLLPHIARGRNVGLGRNRITYNILY